MVNRRNQLLDKGFMLIELIAAITILLILATMAVPLARNEIIRSRETRLREELRTLRNAIDAYKASSDIGIIPIKVDTFGYPPRPANFGGRCADERDNEREIQIPAQDSRGPHDGECGLGNERGAR